MASISVLEKIIEMCKELEKVDKKGLDKIAGRLGLSAYDNVQSLCATHLVLDVEWKIVLIWSRKENNGKFVYSIDKTFGETDIEYKSIVALIKDDGYYNIITGRDDGVIQIWT